MTAKFSRKLIFNRRARFFAALAPYIDLTVSGDVLNRMVEALLDAAPPHVTRNAVFESVRALAGITLTRKEAAAFAWRLAGNIPALVAGQAVTPWAQQLRDEVVPVCVERVVGSRRRNKPGYILYCRVLAGSPCSLVIPQFFYADSLRAISKVVGFSTNSWGPMPYSGVAVYFVNLQFFAHLEVDLSRTQPGFRRVSVSSGMLKANKNILAVRYRTRPCPFNYEHSCANCFKGYADCGFAVHLKTYVEAHCRTCDSPSFFDPEGPGLMCVNCAKASHNSCIKEMS